MPEGLARCKRRRPQGQEGRAQQGLERPLPAGEGAREGRRRLRDIEPVVPAAGRRPRRLRAGRGRRLGDLGPVPGRRRGRDRRAHARRRHRPRRQPPVLSRVAATSPTRIPTSSQAILGRSARSTAGCKANPERGRRAVLRRRSASRRRCSRWRVGAHGATACKPIDDDGGRPSSRRSPTRSSSLGLIPKPIKIADAVRKASSHERSGRDRRRRCWFLPTHGDGRYLGTAVGGRARSISPICARSPQAADGSAISACCCRPGGAARIPGSSPRRWRR